MRVAINALLLSGQFSGVEKAIWSFLRHIGEGAEDEFVALVGSDFDERLLDGARVGIERLPVTNRSRLARIVYEERWLARRLKGFDLFHAPGYVAPKRLPCPLVLTVYDLVALTHPELAKRSNVLHYRWRLPRSARAAARIIVPLECVARQVAERLGVERERVRVVPLGVDARLKPPSLDARARVRARHHLSRPYILFVGNVEPKKNLPTLLRAFASLKRGGLPHELAIAGKQGWKCREVLRLPAELGIEADVRLLGYVEEEDLAGLYGGAELFAFPSLVEGFGLPPLEAMACGTPVVASDAEALVESTGDAAERFPALDAPALADAIRRVLSDAALRERLRATGFARAAQFTWPRAAELTRAVYREARVP
ncbi:MAG: glycosyltransferase family 4 protein [Planctomycetes bacterium]|nr:glycosyltransferase family 4 protein [Planctomycetota bacterium]